jgi:hypothetical protein
LASLRRSESVAHAPLVMEHLVNVRAPPLVPVALGGGARILVLIFKNVLLRVTLGPKRCGRLGSLGTASRRSRASCSSATIALQERCTCAVFCRKLRHIGLAGNRLAVQSCIVLAAGMRMSRSLDTLVLDANPLGPDGGAAMIEALARRHVGAISMRGCNFSNAAVERSAGGDGAFDVQRPSGAYSLDLARAAQYALAGVLCRYWRHEGPATWKSASLDGAVRSADVLLPRCCRPRCWGCS